MKNVHLLSTPQPSRLHVWTDENGSRLELCKLEDYAQKDAINVGKEYYNEKFENNRIA
jgi:hypothetical protein